MKVSFARGFIFALIALPLGFILTAFGFAVTQTPIEAPSILPWALAISVGVGCVAGIWRPSPEAPGRTEPSGAAHHKTDKE